eukprot:scaffold2422_cov171-Amphora_coffeaeformis.AAC.5
MARHGLDKKRPLQTKPICKQTGTVTSDLMGNFVFREVQRLECLARSIRDVPLILRVLYFK